MLANLLPLYIVIALGFISTKWLELESKTIANLTIYIITPVVIFCGLLKTPLSLSYMLVPVITFLIAITISFVTFKIAKLFFKDGVQYLIGLAAGSGNTGYFGIPLVLAFLGPTALPLHLCIIPGISLFESTLGYYLISRGNFSQKESLQRVFKLPFLYAFILGISANFMGFTLPEWLSSVNDKFLGCYTVLGMMLVGMGLNASGKFTLSFDKKFLLTILSVRFIVWPLTVSLLIFLDKTFFQLFDAQAHKVFLLASAVPIAANVVAFATQMGFQVERAATAVLVSTVISPFVIWLLLQL